MKGTVQELTDIAASCAAVPVWPLSEPDLLDALDGIHAAQQMLHAALLHVVREIDGRAIPTEHAATSTTVWLRNRLRISPGTAARMVTQARLLDNDPILDRGISRGRVNNEQLTAIAAALGDLPKDLDPTTREQATTLLTDWAPRLDPNGLRISGQRILDHIAPEVAEATEEARLRRAEQRAREQRFFTLSPLGDGRVRLRGILDAESAATISAALDPLCRPGHTATHYTATRYTATPNTPRPNEPHPANTAPPMPTQSDLPPTGSAQDGSAQDGSAQDGSAQDGSAQDGSAQGESTLHSSEPTGPMPAAPAPDGSTSARPAPAPDGSAHVEPMPIGSGLDSTYPQTYSRTAAELAETGETRTPAQRRVDALVEICRLTLAGGRLPEQGGDRPQIAVTVDYDVLRQELASGTLDTGETVSAETVRRMACDARILPLILDGESQILDAGRTRRLVTGSLRRALVVRDRGCTFPGCDRPARWCDAHHIISWSKGGPTALGNLALLCEHHHRLIHDNRKGWTVRLGPDQRPEFLPPAWLDPQRAPRTNPYHRRT
ncbi:DUF222 domain-containing protein [Actinoplanes sp. NPDC051861]|uniref:HNH endonuclease signature motif containing protein n=1 Tax=Actinoplanes sp. NPDC051861 TaxID=3155170 RepID=UPI0034476988